MDLKTRLARVTQRSYALLRDEGFFPLINKILQTLAFMVMIRVNGGNMILIRYQEWLKKTGILTFDGEAQSAEIASFSSHPLFTIICFGEGARDPRASIKSLTSQTYPYWRAYILKRENTDLIEVLDERVSIIQIDKEDGTAQALNKAASSSEGEITLFMEFGDLLTPNALFEVAKVFNENPEVDVVYSDEQLLEKGRPTKPQFKPAFDLESLRANNYIGDLFALRQGLGDQIGWFDAAFFERARYDLTLRAVQASRFVAHIPKILYQRVAADLQAPTDMELMERIIQRHLDRTSPGACAKPIPGHELFHITYPLMDHPLITILIPNYEHLKDLRMCLNSIWDRSTYQHYEIIILENNSADPALFEYYEEISKRPDTRVLRYDEPFNYSNINNFGVQHANGEYILLLNNDIEVITPNWLEVMLSHAVRPEVGMVGARLYYPNNTIQHDGVVIGLGHVAGHINVNFRRSINGYLDRSRFTKQFSAVTAACVLIPKKVYDEVGGLDPEYKIAYGDVDLCLRIRRQGYWITCPVDAELFHYESKTRGLDTTREKALRFEQERDRLLNSGYSEIEGGDPYYNPNLDLYMHNQLDWHPRPARVRILPSRPNATEPHQ